VRIIAGAWRGRTLLAPPGQGTRPTSDRAREALFSMLQSRLGSFEGLEVADPFAGTGALGLEALSRGAARCTFAETDRTALDTLRRNAATLGAGDRADIRSLDGTRLTGGPFHLVLMDPPYSSGLGARTLAHMVQASALAPGALISLETARTEQPDLPDCELIAERSYGKARLRLLRWPA
jgi:16S rRNA (guanine966-N2)-methyltransferase